MFQFTQVCWFLCLFSNNRGTSGLGTKATFQNASKRERFSVIPAIKDLSASGHWLVNPVFPFLAITELPWPCATISYRTAQASQQTFVTAGKLILSASEIGTWKLYYSTTVSERSLWIDQYSTSFVNSDCGLTVRIFSITLSIVVTQPTRAIFLSNHPHDRCGWLPRKSGTPSWTSSSTHCTEANWSSTSAPSRAVRTH